MNKTLLFLLKSILPLIVCICLPATSDEIPFWKAKKNVYKKIQEEKTIIVSAKTITQEHSKKITLTSAGWVQAPLTFVYKMATDFDKYAQILPFVEKTDYNVAENILSAKGEFLSLKADIKMQIQTIKEKQKGLIKFKIIKGIFKDLTGTILMEEIHQPDKDDVTECSLKAQYEGESKIPLFLTQWGLEFIGQKMAYKMRSYMESEWQKQN